MGMIRKILLAEDNPDDAELTLFGLRSVAPALEIDVVHDGAEVLEYLGAGRSRTGGEARGPAVAHPARRENATHGWPGGARRHQTPPGPAPNPVVMLTSSREPRDIVESYDLGANAYPRQVDGARRFHRPRSASRRSSGWK
jgi:CheY-like chemotaxis protein